MASDRPSPFLVDAVKASASRFKETKNALEARQRELDAREAELQTRAADLERQAERLKGEREEFQKDKEQVTAARATIDHDLGTVRVEREKSGAEERRVQEWARTLNDREKAIKDNEDRVRRLDMDLSGHLKESEAKIQSLLEREELAAQRERALADTIERLVGMERGLAVREEELIKLQNERLRSLEARERDMLKITEEMHARQKESSAQHKSFVELQDTLRQELTRLATERERLAGKEKSLIEAERYLAAALEASGIDVAPEEERSPPPPPMGEPRAPKPPVPQPTAPPNAPPPIIPPIRTGESLRDEIFEEEHAESRPKVSRSDALERMTRALETAKKARDLGRNVSDIRKVL